MSQKNKDGTLRTYLQLVESRRVNGKPRQVLLVNLGRVDGEDGKEKIEKLTEALVEASTRLALLDAGRDLQADWSKEYGAVLIFRRLWEELGFEKILGVEFLDVQTQFDLKEAIFNMVLNRLTEPSSKRQLNLWEEDGVFILTSNTKLKPLGVVEYYKSLWQVEMAFRQLKTELEMGPVYHWKDRRIQAHVMICFMALILRTVFYKKLSSHNKDVSWTEVMHDINALKAIGLKIKSSQVILRTELKEGANIAFRSLSMRPPNRILSQQPLNNVVIRH